MLTKLYQFLIIFFFPFIVIFFCYRLCRGKEDPKRFFERFGYTKLPKAKLPVIWFHAASVGEFLSIEHLIKLMQFKYPAYQILLTTATRSSAHLVESKQIANLIHQIVPFDDYFSVRRFMKHWQPVLSIFVESELWPNTLSQSALHGKLALINARMTDKSYKTWQKYNSFYKEVMNLFDYIDAQSSKDQQRIKDLGAKEVSNSGNLKFNTQALAINEEETTALKQQIGTRPVFLIISTHHNEEERLALVHQELLLTYPDLLTIIAPRHPDRCKELVSSLKKLGVKKIVRKSEANNIDVDTDIYIVDEIGVLGNYVNLTDIVFVGGSLVAIGGHNILEIAKLEKVIIVGKYMDNYFEITQDFLAHNALIQIQEDLQLIKILQELFSNKELLQTYINNAKKIIAKNSQTTQVIMQNLELLINK